MAIQDRNGTCGIDGTVMIPVTLNRDGIYVRGCLCEVCKAFYFRILSRRSEFVFVKDDGLPYQHWHVHKPFKKLLKQVGLNPRQWSWRDIRHTTGTLLHLKGADPLAIKDHLRHTDLKTTHDFYIGSDIEYQREQIARLSLHKKEAKA